MANEKELEKAAKRDKDKPGMGPKGAVTGISVPPPAKNVNIDPQWTQEAFKKKPVVKKAKGGMVSRGWGKARVPGKK